MFDYTSLDSYRPFCITSNLVSPKVQVRSSTGDGVARGNVYPQGGAERAEAALRGRNLRLHQDSVQQGLSQQRVLSGELVDRVWPLTRKPLGGILQTRTFYRSR